jgi:hypothetical protein
MFVAGINVTIYQAMPYRLGVHQWNLRGIDFVQYLKVGTEFQQTQAYIC